MLTTKQRASLMAPTRSKQGTSAKQHHSRLPCCDEASLPNSGLTLQQRSCVFQHAVQSIHPVVGTL